MANSTNSRNIQYVLLAEFDIDKGSSLTHQYPGPIGTQENLLAELMLPDGAHLRKQDWTIFFLHLPNKNKTVAGKDYEYTGEDLLFVINLVVTRHDSGVRRGALCKSMAICTYSRYIQIYKPILLVALDEYFLDPSIDVLSKLYDTINNLHLNVPNFNNFEKLILRSCDNPDIIFDKMKPFLQDYVLDSQLENKEVDPTNLLSKKDKRSSGTSYAGTIDSTFFKSQRRVMYDVISGERRVLPINYKKFNAMNFNTSIDMYNVSIPISVPLILFSEEVGDFSLIQLVNVLANSQVVNHVIHPHVHSCYPSTSTPAITIMLNALLTQKNVLFLGHGLSAESVSNYVLSACAMGSGSGIVLKGFLERAFPYTNLTNIDSLLEHKGFIAGTTNPAFEEHQNWWDILCNLKTNKLIISPFILKKHPLKNEEFKFEENNQNLNKMSQKANSEKTELVNLDQEFVAELTHHVNMHYSEYDIRNKFYEHVKRFVDLSDELEREDVPNNELGEGVLFLDNNHRKRELSFYMMRLKAFQRTDIYKLHKLFPYRNTNKIKGVDVYRQISKFKTYPFIEDKEIIAIYTSFLNNINTDEEIVQFLSNFQLNKEGLSIITVTLFHKDKRIRNYTVQFLNRIYDHSVGKKFISNLNIFHKLAYERQSLISDPNEKTLDTITNFVNSLESMQLSPSFEFKN